MPPKLQEGVDYELNEAGLVVMTAHYLRKRGYCCGNRCQNCPYPPQVQQAAVDAKRRQRTFGLG